MNSRESKSIINKIKEENISKNIFWHIHHKRILKLIRYSKEFQTKLSVSMYNYKKNFILDHFHLNFTTVSSKEILSLLNNDFNNFDRDGDEKILESILEEIKDSERIINLNKSDKDILGHRKHHSIFGHLQNLEMNGIIDNSNKKIVSLDLNSNGFDDDDKKYEYLGPQFDLIKMYSGPCKTLKILKTDSNFVIPVSILLNLENLKIYLSLRNILTFLNDTEKNSYSLKNLRFVKIARIKDEYPVIRKKLEYNKINKIKFYFPNIEDIIIDIDLNKDAYILKNYFKLNLIDDRFDSVINNRDLNDLYNYFKEKIINYKFSMVTVHLKLDLTYRKKNKKIIMKLEMNKYNNGLKCFTFEKSLFKNSERVYDIIEGFREDYSNRLIPVLYYNRNEPLDIIDKSSLINSVNYITFFGDKNNNIEKKVFVKLFDIKENNYSVQHIVISINKSKKYFKSLIKNIKKYKVLKNLIIKDYIDDKNIFINFIKDISDMKLLKTVKIRFKGKLDKATLDFMKKNFPKFSCSRIIYSDINEYYLSRTSIK